MPELPPFHLSRRMALGCARCLLLLAVLLAAQAACAGAVLERVKAGATVRVCIWPAYYGITLRNPRNQQLTGIDIELSGEFAREQGLKLEYVDSSFATLAADLLGNRCDVAMFAVGVTPERQLQLRFTQPYLQSDIYGVTTRSSRIIRNWDDIDQAGVLVGVQAATFMEPVMAQALKQAKMVVIRAPQTREEELEAGRVDVFMTDYPFSRRLLDNADWARLVAPPRPFHPVPYAYAVKPGDEAWWQLLDQFVARIRRDGRLDAAAKRHGLSEIVFRK
jgi:ABC-type amino acid transport substrate-binding protein